MEKKEIQRTLDLARLKLFNLETESTVALGSETSDEGEIISTNPLQVKLTEPDELTDKPPCPNCGEAARIQSNGIRKSKDGSSSQRWRCNACKKNWSVAIDSPAND